MKAVKRLATLAILCGAALLAGTAAIQAAEVAQDTRTIRDDFGEIRVRKMDLRSPDQILEKNEMKNKTQGVVEKDEIKNGRDGTIDKDEIKTGREESISKDEALNNRQPLIAKDEVRRQRDKVIRKVELQKEQIIKKGSGKVITIE